jgi:hypothetical protein
LQTSPFHNKAEAAQKRLDGEQLAKEEERVVAKTAVQEATIEAMPRQGNVNEKKPK